MCGALGKFVHYDPLRAMEENARPPRQQTLSYAAYYKLYGTTVEVKGWKMVKPMKAGDPPVYYVKQIVG